MLTARRHAIGKEGHDGAAIVATQSHHLCIERAALLIVQFGFSLTEQGVKCGVVPFAFVPFGPAFVPQ